MSWTVATALPVALEHHSTARVDVAHGAFAFVTGGLTTEEGGAADLRRSVLRAEVDQHGVPGAFTEEATLLEPKAMHAQAQSEANLYWAGGLTMQNEQQMPSTTVELGKVDVDGHLTLQTLSPLLHPALYASASVAQGWLVIAGGVVDAAVSSVQMAAVRGDGTLEPFLEAPSLPEPRSHHAAVVLNGRIYLLGGFNARGDAPNTVVRSIHDGDGRVMGWEAAGLMPSSLRVTSAVVWHGQVLVLGGNAEGLSTDVFANQLWSVIPDGNSVLKSFVPMDDALPMPAANAGNLALSGNHLLRVGGQTSMDLPTESAVLVGTLW